MGARSIAPFSWNPMVPGDNLVIDDKKLAIEEVSSLTGGWRVRPRRSDLHRDRALESRSWSASRGSPGWTSWLAAPSTCTQVEPLRTDRSSALLTSSESGRSQRSAYLKIAFLELESSVPVPIGASRAGHCEQGHCDRLSCLSVSRRSRLAGPRC
jgi:hypothetical protein